MSQMNKGNCQEEIAVPVQGQILYSPETVPEAEGLPRTCLTTNSEMLKNERLMQNLSSRSSVPPSKVAEEELVEPRSSSECIMKYMKMIPVDGCIYVYALRKIRANQT